MTATLNYRYTYIGGTMVVYEYEGGRRGHSYEGKAEGTYGVTLFPPQGRFLGRQRCAVCEEGD